METKAIRRIVRDDSGPSLLADEHPGAPFVIADAASDWRAVEAWSNDFFRRRFATRMIPVSTSDSRVFNPEAGNRRTFPSERMTVASYLEDVDSPPETRRRFRYLANIDITGFFPELLDDLEFESLMERTEPPRPFLWYSTTGSVTPLHYDPIESTNVHVQIRGSKRWALFSPDASDKLHPYPGTPQFSQIDLANLDAEESVPITGVTCYETTLRPGDALYIPPRWWHWVEAITDSVSVNVWYR